MKIGVYFGCFIPLHEGHIKLIKQARAENDKVILGVCGFDGDRGDDFIPFEDRIHLMRWIYSDYEDIILSIVDDKAIGLTGKFDIPSWKIWCDELFKQCGIDPYDTNIEFTWYTGDKDYAFKIGQIYPNHKFSVATRKKTNIDTIETLSGTKIRENPKRYLKSIHPVFATYLESKHIVQEET